MSDTVTFSPTRAEVLYNKYRETNSGRSIPRLYAFEKSKSVSENLDELALFALQTSTVLPVLYSCHDIFLDLVSRWTHRYSEFEEKFSTTTTTTIPGTIVLATLARIIRVYHQSINITEHFVSSIAIFERLLTNSSVSSAELEVILLSFYRLISFDRHRFNSTINPQVLYSIISTNNTTDFAVSKFLAIKVLAIFLNLSEAAEQRLIDHHIGSQPVLGTYENDQDIDYRFLALLEAKRLANFTNLPSVTDTVITDIIPSSTIITISASDLHPTVTSVCGILISNFNQTQDPSQQVIQSNFVPTDSAVAALRDIAITIQSNKPVMVYGKAGSGKTFLISELARLMNYDTSIVKIHLGEQTDAKLLLGTYSSGEKPGTFQWMAGVLTTAVKEGKWVLVEDIDKAPTEVLSVLLTLLEKRELTIPSRGEVIKAQPGFQLISTIRIANDSTKDIMPDLIGSRLWHKVKVDIPNEQELVAILHRRFPLLQRFLQSFIRCYDEVIRIYSLSSFVSLNKGSNPRVISFRDLVKFCSRCNKILVNHGIVSADQLLESSIYDGIFSEAVDCFGSAITEPAALTPLINSIGAALEIPTSRVQLYVANHVPLLIDEDEKLRIGRAVLNKSLTVNSTKKSHNVTSFARTNHSLRLMEQIGVAIEMTEPTLLVGETGTGKTTVVQQMAKLMNKKLVVINVSQQTESGDLLGGYKPISAKSIAIPIQETFEELFTATFSEKKNAKFSQLLAKCFNKSQWKNVIKLWKEAIKMAMDILDTNQSESVKKKRKLNNDQKSALGHKWHQFESEVADFELKAGSLDTSFSFKFVEGSLVKAVRQGDWLLLDEINLASPDTLESIADLLSESVAQRSLLLTERGDVESIAASPEFRLFGCMNPSTDVGKRDLPQSIRSRFTEIYVHSPDQDMGDLLAIIDKYISRFALGDEWVGNDIAELYLQAKTLSATNKIVDGANQRPHFSIRTLTRTLVYVSDIVSIYGLRRSLYEGFCMSFLTLLDATSEQLLQPLIAKYTVGRLKNVKSVMHQIPPQPSRNGSQYVQFKHYWLKQGSDPVVDQPHYIITPFVEKNMLNLVRAIAGERFPILVQGPTSAGKTSMIHYLASISGHKFVRINNHEHTDLQEYLGTYVSDSSGKLTFKEGVLVEALRKGYWLVLDELNLAPTDVLEALNRLLDDNRELFIPETQEVIHPHPDFMIFATQNPPGLYGGRKVLSRAFRNRFLELHFDDIPQDELEIILKERCQIAPSYGKKIVEVYKQLSVQRQSSRLFEQKNSFATLRDLFRWAQREAVGYEELAANGYMLLAERVRNHEEKVVVKQTIERVMKVVLDMDAYYEKLEDKALFAVDSSIVWTKAMRRLAVLVSTSLKYREPLLLVGETGCGKTTVCQILAQYMNKQLITVNAHQNTETGDLLGAQRPVRNRAEVSGQLLQKLAEYFQLSSLSDVTLDELLTRFDHEKHHDEDITQLRNRANVLFEWADGPLIHAMKDGQLFLLDEISLADDSVLERLNSVLEPERTILLAEKGTDNSFIAANEGFEFLATMNPGGDYGKKELSPALRNRFTEVWVPSMESFDDVREIVSNKLVNKVYVDAIVQFSQWFATKFGGGNASSGVISLRDILAWVEFINSCSETITEPVALLNGACMVFIDALGTNATAHWAENEVKLMELRAECIRELSTCYGTDLLPYYISSVPVTLSDTQLTTGMFSIPVIGDGGASSFNLSAPTTAANAMRVVRAMQVIKPILLEGSPGVGKTSLVSALAKATGHALVRINLSEQTDLVDLFGSDAPVEGGTAGQFAWRDAPFLRAMQLGEWVLLDEMNLASQSVLEGLNACLDHRGEAYIPELDRAFPRHADFKVFAAQNPQYQGGGRKGLPKSFVNRFNVVYVDTLKEEDLRLIAQHLYPQVDPIQINKLISYVSQLEQQVVVQRNWGASGGPWEFNLRDTLRWLELYTSNSINESVSVADFFAMIITSRFRSHDDKQKATELFVDVFGQLQTHDNYWNMSSNYVQSRGAYMLRNTNEVFNDSSNQMALQCNYSAIETAIRCVNLNLPLILTGPTEAGKTELVRFLAHTAGAKLEEFAMNSEVDSMDILGGYEQVDLTREVMKVVDITQGVVVHILSQVLVESLELTAVCLQLLEHITQGITISNYHTFHTSLHHLVHNCDNDNVNVQLTQVYSQSEALLKKLRAKQSIKFEWFDGLLIRAVESGSWLVLDNANLCNPSVLDRLNSLLETNGSLIVNECSNPDGTPRVIVPHPQFRLFLTVNPKYGELSRAMRNRGVEVFLEAMPERTSEFDNDVLSHKTASSYLPVTESRTRSWVTVDDVLSRSSVTASSLDMFSAVSSVLTLTDCQHIDAWKSTVLNSSEFSQSYKNTAVDLCNLVQFMATRNVLNVIGNVYSTSLSANSVVANNLAAYTTTQSIHLLVNEYLNTAVSTVAPESTMAESTDLFSVIINMIHSQQLVDITQAKAMEAKISDLSYVEKSAAHLLGRNIKVPPRLAVFKFLKELVSFIDTVFNDSLHSIFTDKSVYKALVHLQLMWQGLWTSSHTQNESQVRIYQDMVVEWSNSCQSIEVISRHLPQLNSIVAEFGQRLQLTTGQSMDTLWSAFRNNYPHTHQGWTDALMLFELCHQFDEVAKAQFVESRSTIDEFRAMIVDVYQSIVQGTIGSPEFAALYDTLTKGIANLKAVSDTFIITRHNHFEYEFSLICCYLRSAMTFGGDNEKLIQLSFMASTPTRELLGLSTSDQFRPYPAVLSHSWIQQDSFTGPYFTNGLAQSLLNKVAKLGGQPGKYLPQVLVDMKTLMGELGGNSQSILTNQTQLFAHILVVWITKFAEAHGDSYAPHDLQYISSYEYTGESIATLIEVLLKSTNSFFYSVIEKYLGPSLYLVSGSGSNTSRLGKAWVLFACGALHLFVPSSSTDPAIREYVHFQQFEDQKQHLTNVIDAWRVVRTVRNGDEVTKVEDSLAKVEDLEVPLKPKVFRKNESIDQLFEEWNAFMESSGDEQAIADLLEQTDQLSDSDLASQMCSLLQRNSSQFIVRLQTNYPLYADINDIVTGYVYALKLGFQLIQIAKSVEVSRHSFDGVSAVDASVFLSPSHLSSLFYKGQQLSKELGIDSHAPEQLMLYFMKLSFVHDDHQVLAESLRSLYYRWSLRRMKEEELNQQKGSLYKHTQVDEDAEEDFKKLFPDYEQVLDVDATASSNGGAATNASRDDTYYMIAKTYMEYFLHQAVPDIADLIREGTKLVSVSESRSQMSASVLSSVIAEMFDSYTNYHTPQTDFNFYRDGSTTEFKRATELVSNLLGYVLKLLAEWPEHATLQNLAQVAQEFLLFPPNYSMTRVLQKIEQLYTYIAEWQKYASSQVSLKTHFDELTHLIVSWRKLELSTWKQLFDYEEEELKKHIGKWWFHLFEAIIIPTLSGEEVQTSSLLSTLNIFMSKATYGEYESQLELLKAFNSHIHVIAPHGPVDTSLANFISFYNQFTPAIKESLAASKLKLGKDITEVILLASWKDVNIDALKQSARRSHNSLYKIVRKYRSVLSQPVNDMVETGLSGKVEEPNLVVIPHIVSSVRSDEYQAVCLQVASFANRPKRLQNLSMVDKNMTVYVKQINEDTVPSLLEYANEIVDQMNELKRETPATATEKNKKLVANLKTQKRKLLSDTLKELRRIGVSTSMKKETLGFQSSVVTIMSNTSVFDDSLNGSDVYYWRILDMLPRLRAAVGSVSEDVPPADAERGLAAAENLLHTLIVQRDPLSSLARNVTELRKVYTHLQHVTTTTTQSLIKTSQIESIQLTVKQIKSFINYVPKLIDFCIHVGQAVASSGHSVTLAVFDTFKSRFVSFQSQIGGITGPVYTEHEQEVIERFGTVYTEFMDALSMWKSQYPTTAFIADSIIGWCHNIKLNTSITSSTSLTSLSTVTQVEQSLRDLSNSILVAVQQATAVNDGTISEDDDKWLATSQQRLIKYVKALHTQRIISRLESVMNDLCHIEHGSESSVQSVALIAVTLPIVENYLQLCQVVLGKSRQNYWDMSKSTYVLSSALLVLATKGFCAPEPPNEQKQDENLHDGTGLGDGEGATNASNDIEQDDDLTEDAQKPNEDQKEKDEGEEDDNEAVDMEGDMAGELEEASDQEKEDGDEGDDEEELDEEVDDIDDLDPNAVDEKMWDEEAKEDSKEKESDDVDNAQNDDEMEANENEDDAKSDQKPKEGGDDADEKNEEGEEEEKEGEGDEEEEEDVGEMEDEVNHDEGEKLDDHVPETEVLDLPDDMNLDDGDEPEQEDSEEPEKFDDMDVDENEEEKEKEREEDHEAEGEEEAAEDAEDAEGEQEATEDAQVNEDANEDQEEGEGEDQEPQPEEEEEASVVKDEDKEGGNDGQIDQETAEGADGNDDDNNDVDMESAVKQEFGDKGEGADNQVTDENNDIGASGSASMDAQQQDMKEEASPDDARESAKESLKQLGDALKEFHRRRQEIKEVYEEEETAKTEETVAERPDEFQHVEGENADYDTQALGAADTDQIQKIDEDMAIDDEEVDQNQEPVTEEAQDAGEDMEIDEAEAEEEEEEAEADADAENASGDTSGQTKGALIGERRDVKDDISTLVDDEMDDIIEEEAAKFRDITIDSSDTPPVDIEQARELWKQSERATLELSSGLCEQLRLILEPTLATKLRGDYKTGKRLNMKRIIPYIASDFRKDKIWLRRTKPSKREYQIMIAVDDSKSMSESKSTSLAFHSIALVSKALTQLESGGLSVVRFGEDVKVVHPFDKPFSQDTGPRVFQWFDFQQSRTDIKQLCKSSLDIFEASRASITADLWQLQIILSDGVCEDHETVQRLVRKAREEKIMMVFVVMDGINSNESILDMSQVRYVSDEAGGMSLKVDKYLDSFPFEYYVIVRDIAELPEMLALILRQYFSELAR